MNVVVTSGPTREPVDDVRYLSNVSTGRLGIAIAEAFAAAGHAVTLLRGVGSEKPRAAGVRSIEFTSAADLLERLLGTLAEVKDALLVHAAAVADYAPRPAAGKIASTQPALALQLSPTPKVVDAARARHPELPIVLFKLESGIARDELHARARKAMQRVGAAAVVANLVQDVGPERHRADLLRADGTTEALASRAEIANAVVREAERIERTRTCRTS